MVKRHFSRLCKLPKSHSFFLFGARGTGKTSLLHECLKGKKTMWIDFLDQKIEDRYARNPGLLFDELVETHRDIEWVIIDEVQRVPQILNTVHRIIENKDWKPPFIALTGSSARKLKRGGANLLAGRAFVKNLYPLTHLELGEAFDLEQVLNFGSLPKIFSFDGLEDATGPSDFLTSYALTYLKEEVWAEHLIEQIEPFRLFLEIAAQTSGQIINFAKIARDVNVDEKTVKKYFQILEDTLLGFILEPVAEIQGKVPRASPGAVGHGDEGRL